MAYFESTYRVSYGDTDQMGVVYYANYLELFERSRTEMLRESGLPYRKMEEMGLILPVREAHCDYLASAEYDDLLTLRSYVAEAKGATLKIATEIYRDKQLLVKGYVVLVCVNRETRKVIRIPDYVKAKCDELKFEE
ncbi:MAG: acyl-CoA thioesterase [Lentisphaeria bacterium]|nr:acyl-CoA thioesterase [Lentisphaeria bacterium]MBR7127012.1 acyl-CoA thioesterase [Lentisphaeria bacterium]